MAGISFRRMSDEDTQQTLLYADEDSDDDKPLFPSAAGDTPAELVQGSCKENTSTKAATTSPG